EAGERKALAQHVAQRVRDGRLDGGGRADEPRDEVVRAVALEEVGRLRVEVRVHVGAQLQDRLLTDARHQVGREVFGDALGDGENDEQDGDGAPRLEARVGDDVLESEEGR